RAEEQKVSLPAIVYVSPATLPPAARMRQGAAVITVLQVDTVAAVAAWEPAVCVGRAWTVVAAKMSAVKQASASVAAARAEVVSVRFVVASSRLPPVVPVRTGWPGFSWVIF